MFWFIVGFLLGLVVAVNMDDWWAEQYGVELWKLGKTDGTHYLAVTKESVRMKDNCGGVEGHAGAGEYPNGRANA